MSLPRVAVRGGGDLGTGVAHRLYVCGFPVTILELPRPRVIRRTVSFAQAVFAGEHVVEGVLARRDAEPWTPGLVAVRIDPEGLELASLAPDVLVDARMTKRNQGTHPGQARVVVGLGPGFEAGRDVHWVVETQRGHDLGRVVRRAQSDTGVPGDIGGQTARRVVKSPASGRFEACVELGDRVDEGQLLGRVGQVEVRSRLTGLLRGLITSGLEVNQGEKLADVDPRLDTDLYTISDKARAIAGGVLEAILRSEVELSVYPAGESATAG
ncbi:MAG: hypothetical protein AMXMBFR33_43770 [Candidatus Xenobia bacterium]